MKPRLVLGVALVSGAWLVACANGGDDVTGGGGPDAEPGGDGTSPPIDAASDTGTTNDATAPLNDGGADALLDAQMEAEAEAAPVCMPNDAGCMTTNPGACAPGASVCSDAGDLVCQPLETTQPCYTGPPQTENVGLCKPGTQSCIGTLGTCNGEVLPAAHDDCFTNTDDDCDGTVGNGCPESLFLGPDRALGGAGGGGGGSNPVHCPAGAFVTRVDSWFDDSDQHASGVSIYCATPNLMQGATTYSITLTPNTPAPYLVQHGANDPQDERADDCGISGLTAITYTVGLADTYVEALGNHCGTSQVTLAADNTITFDFVTTGNTSYNAYASMAGTFFNQACNSNEVVVGFNIHDGSWLDNIAPICAELEVKYK